jgi:hypothetical protein
VRAADLLACLLADRLHAEPVNEEQALAEAHAPPELGFPLVHPRFTGHWCRWCSLRHEHEDQEQLVTGTFSSECQHCTGSKKSEE